MNIWIIISMFLFGFIGGLIIESLLLRDKINNATIEIKRPKMKKNSYSEQDFNSIIIPEKKKKRRKIINFKNRKK